MSDRISNDAPRNACSRPEDDATDQVMSKAEDPVCRDRLVSAPPPDWDRIPNTCDANAAAAAKNAGAGGRTTSHGSTNAARTADQDIGVYAAAGTTYDGGSVFAGAAWMKGTRDGTQVEVASVSAQVGGDTEVQVTGARIGTSGKNLSGSAEALTASAHLGVHNSDGSIGLHAGASATMSSAEVTFTHSGSSATIGYSQGFGGEVSSGVRDADQDGVPELCFRLGGGPVVVGACVEVPLLFIKP